MAQTSINLQTVSLSGSEKHNNRTVAVGQTLHYADPELSHKNESWTGQPIYERLNEINDFAEKQGGRKLRSDANPIREAVVIIEDRHTMKDLKNLAEDIKQEHGIECFQIHIHKDEGRFVDADGKTQIEREKNKWIDIEGNEVPKPGPDSGLIWKLNNHAHMLFDVQHKKSKIVEKKYRKKKDAPVEIRKYDLKGKVRKVMDLDYSKLQTTTANSLGMERGISKKITQSEHLDPVKFKRQEAEKQRAEAEMEKNRLQAEAQALEQKKNQAERRNTEVRMEYIELRERFQKVQEGGQRLIEETSNDIQAVDRYTNEEIESAISQIDEAFTRLEQYDSEQTTALREAIREEERRIQQILQTDEARALRALQKDFKPFQRYFDTADSRNAF